MKHTWFFTFFLHILASWTNFSAVCFNFIGKMIQKIKYNSKYVGTVYNKVGGGHGWQR